MTNWCGVKNPARGFGDYRPERRHLERQRPGQRCLGHPSLSEYALSGCNLLTTFSFALLKLVIRN
jgi:hypothetical protein